MSLEIAQSAPINQDMWGKMDPAALVPFGPPTTVDTIENGASITVAPTPVRPRLVRLLAKGIDQKVVWPNGAAETLKAGVAELRVVPAGTALGCAAA